MNHGHGGDHGLFLSIVFVIYFESPYNFSYLEHRFPGTPTHYAPPCPADRVTRYESRDAPVTEISGSLYKNRNRNQKRKEAISKGLERTNWPYFTCKIGYLHLVLAYGRLR